MKHNDEQVIKATVRGFLETWVAGNVDAVMQLWDPKAHDALTYVSADNDAPHLGFEAIKGYFQAVAGYITVTGADMTDPYVRILDNDTAYAICNFTWFYKINDQQLSDTTRATFVLNRRGERWYYVDMHESVRELPPA